MKVLAALQILSLIIMQGSKFYGKQVVYADWSMHHLHPASQLNQEEDKEPEFPGGEEAMINFIRTNVIYPEKALAQNFSGKVLVKFIVEKDGSISNVEIFKGVSPELDAEAKRVVSIMPNWSPGIQKGKVVRTSLILPICFILPKEIKKNDQSIKKKSKR